MPFAHWPFGQRYIYIYICYHNDIIKGHTKWIISARPLFLVSETVNERIINGAISVAVHAVIGQKLLTRLVPVQCSQPSVDFLDQIVSDLYIWNTLTNHSRAFNLWFNSALIQWCSDMYELFFLHWTAFECINGRNYFIRLFVQNHSLFESNTEMN